MYKLINKSEIIIENKFKIRQFQCSKQLTNSLKKKVITPIILFLDNSKLYLIDGFRRIENSCEVEFYSIIYDDKNEAFEKAVELNMLSSPYHEIEKAYVLKIAKEYFNFTDEEIVKKINPLLGLAKKIEILNNFTNIFNLNNELFKFLVEKKAPVAMFLNFLREDEENQLTLYKLFLEKKLSISAIRNIYDLLFYIRKREGETYLIIIEEANLEGNFEKNLIKKRFPKFIKLKEQIDNLKNDYKNVLNFPDDLEETSFLINFKINSKSDIEKLIFILKQLENDERFEKFFKNYE